MPTSTEYGPFLVARERVNTGVHVDAGAIVQTSATGLLDLGGAFLGAGAPILDANGDNWATPQNYPAPHLRKNSLIWQVGDRWYQGGVATARVECTTSGDLVLYVNDPTPEDNSRGWNVRVHVISPSPSPIEPCYGRLGGPTGLLGNPTSGEGWTGDYVGRFRHFAGGSLLWSPDTDCHEVHGEIRRLYAARSWERGFLGYPTTDETATPDGRGRYNHFQHGSIYWTPETNAHEVHGSILVRWAQLRWERGPLGYPISDEGQLAWNPTGRFSSFEHGNIYWSPATGAWAIFHGPIHDAWSRNPVFYGLPTADQGDTADGLGKYAHFQMVSFLWSPSTGAWPVRDSIRALYRDQGWERGSLGYPTAEARRSADGIGYYQQFQGGGIYEYAGIARRA